MIQRGTDTKTSSLSTGALRYRVKRVEKREEVEGMPRKGRVETPAKKREEGFILSEGAKFVGGGGSVQGGWGRGEKRAALGKGEECRST